MIDLKAIRKALNITQADISKILGMTQASYNRLENGAWKPRYEKIQEYIEKLASQFPDVDFQRFNIKDDSTKHINIGYAGGIGNIENLGNIDKEDLPKLAYIQSEQIRQLQSIIQTLSNTVERQNEIIANLTRK